MAIIILSKNGINYDFNILILSFFISAFSLVRMLNDNSRPYSLNNIFHAFFLLFMGIAPAFQYKYNSTFWDSTKLNTTDYFLGNILTIIILLSYNLFYLFFELKEKKFGSNIPNNVIYRIPKYGLKSKIFLLLISMLSFFLFFLSRQFNILTLLIKSTSELPQSLNLIIDIFIRPIPIICLVFYKIFNKKFSLFEIFIFLIAIIGNIPIAMSRFQAAALYIPVLIVYFPILRRNINFSLAIIAGVLLIFPFLGQFRNFGNNDISFGFDPSLFLKEDFDSFQNFVLSIKSESITYGWQLLGVIFFFIPRSIWPDKPIGSGHQMAENMNLTFSNISMNYFAEGYINFGYLGIFLFIILIAYLNSSLDKIYWKNQQNIFMQIAFPFLIGMEFFILRGDLMSSFAYTCGILFAISFVYIFTTKRNSKTN